MAANRDYERLMIEPREKRVQHAEDTPAPEKASAVDHVVVEIRDLIRERGLVAGDVLPSETELATMFGTGRNTIREAVRTLKAYGLVESRQKVGAVLTDWRTAAVRDLFSFAMEISTDVFKDIQGFRRLTEMNLGDHLIGRIPEETLVKMERINMLMSIQSDPIMASEYDYQFHQTMVEAAGNRTLTEIYGMLKPVIRKLMETGKAQRKVIDAATEEHAAIIDALRRGEKIDFMYHMNRHLEAGLDFVPN